MPLLIFEANVVYPFVYTHICTNVEAAQTDEIAHTQHTAYSCMHDMDLVCQTCFFFIFL